MEEAARCLHCKNAKCVQGCPVNINIPDFIAEVKDGQFRGGLSRLSPSPAHFRQSAAVYVRRRASVKANVSVALRAKRYSIGKLERFVADWARENGIKPPAPADKERQ